MKGKTIVVLVNDPPVPDPANPSALDAKTFGGKAMTYYGRWTYKFEQGARKGAAAILIVHETGPAGYPFGVVQGNLSEKFDLVAPDKNMGQRQHRGLAHARRGEEAVRDGGTGLRRAEEAGDHARVQAGAARRQGVDGGRQQAAHDRLAQRRREARRQRSGAEGRVRRLHGALGSPRHWRAGERRHHLQRRARQRDRRRDRARDCQGAEERPAAAEAIDPLPDGDGGREGAARLRVLLAQSALSAREDRRGHQHRRHQPVGTGRRTSR